MAVLLLAFLFGQVHPFTAKFEQVTADNNRTDTVCGTVFFAAPWRVYYEVDYPLHQVVSTVMSEMSIYLSRRVARLCH